MMTTLATNWLDVLGEARNAQSAMEQIDQIRQVIAGPGIFSIQLNVTTASDPHNELRLQRFYASPAAAMRWPVNGTKRKTLTPWTETLFVRGQPFVATGEEAMSDAFDDYDQMKVMGINAVVNVPLLKNNFCYATFNVFGMNESWSPYQVLCLRLLALTATRWVPHAPDLMYSFDGVTDMNGV
jgi:hypothetical protein